MLYQDLMCLDLGFLRVRRSRQVLAGYSALSLFHLVPFWQLWDLTSEYMNFLMSGSSTPACPARKDPGQPRSVLHRMTTSHVRYPCLLYTSDAADEEDSVDLGGRRIIKKNKKEE